MELLGSHFGPRIRMSTGNFDSSFKVNDTMTAITAATHVCMCVCVALQSARVPKSCMQGLAVSRWESGSSPSRTSLQKRSSLNISSWRTTCMAECDDVLYRWD